MIRLNHLLVGILAIIFTMLPLSSYAQNLVPFSKITFFGDSLTDNGNFYSDVYEFMPKSPPYFYGRFSNGPVWSEYVDQYYLEKNNVESVNYAIAGQTTIFHNPTKGYLPYTLTMSLDNYLLHTIFSDRSSTLYVLWEGGNDYLPGIDNLDDLTTNVVNSIKSAIESLIYHGGNNFLVINLPDLAATPYGQTNSNKSLLRSASLLHNIKLAAAVAEIQESYKNVNIHLFDVNQLLDNFMKNPDAYNQKYNTHISNTSQSCWLGGYTLAPKKITEEMIARQIEDHLRTRSRSLSSEKTNKVDAAALANYIYTTPALMESYKVSENQSTGLKSCDNPDNFMFWDRIHPTAPMHMMISKTIIDFINQHYQAGQKAA